MISIKWLKTSSDKGRDLLPNPGKHVTRGKKSDLSKLGEFGLIDRLSGHLSDKSKVVVKGIGDDCAVYKSSKDHYQIITTDALVEDVHFIRATHPPRLLGRKFLAVSLSDIAAMGGTPRTAVIALGIPKDLPLAYLDQFYEGLNKMCEEAGISIAGGDTVRSTKGFWISLTLIGEVPQKRFFTRSGARSSHAIMVTGTLGDPALGLRLLSKQKSPLKVSKAARKFLIGRHQNPSPRVKFAQALAQSKLRVSSMIDISDGLEQDLGHICHQSSKGADLDLDSIPKSKELKITCRNNDLDINSFCLTGGEDYELLFTIPDEDVKKLGNITLKVGVPVTRIGSMTSEKGVIRLLKENESPQIRKTSSGFDHFR